MARLLGADSKSSIEEIMADCVEIKVYTSTGELAGTGSLTETSTELHSGI